LATPTDDELVKATARGIRRTLGTAKIEKTPATAERLLAMAANTGAGLKGLRDRALLLIGFAGALRRSELVALNIEDIEETPDGMKITIRHSKTDQEGAGQTIAIPFGKIACPVAALKEWITATGIGSGALFRSVNRHGKVGERLTDQSVSDIEKEHAERLRLNPKQFAGHSLRAGFLTSAAARGASIFKMMDVSRHRSVDTLRGYVRDAELFKEHAGAELFRPRTHRRGNDSGGSGCRALLWLQRSRTYPGPAVLRPARRTAEPRSAMLMLTPREGWAAAPRFRTIQVCPTAESDPDQKAIVSVFTRALEDLGWKEGANIRIDRRWAASDMAGLRTQASELARLGLDSPDGRAA